MSPAEKAIQLMNEAKELLGKEPAPGQFDAFPYYLKSSDIAEIMQISLRSAQRLMNDPSCPTIRHKRKMRVQRDQFFKWIQSLGA